jgi:hypothetical protein
MSHNEPSRTEPSYNEPNWLYPGLVVNKVKLNGTGYMLTSIGADVQCIEPEDTASYSQAQRLQH